jgi:hypothetical protein
MKICLGGHYNNEQFLSVGYNTNVQPLIKNYQKQKIYAAYMIELQRIGKLRMHE